MTRKPSGTKQNAGTKGGKTPLLKKEPLNDLETRGAKVKGGRPKTQTILPGTLYSCVGNCL